MTTADFVILGMIFLGFLAFGVGALVYNAKERREYEALVEGPRQVRFATGYYTAWQCAKCGHIDERDEPDDVCLKCGESDFKQVVAKTVEVAGDGKGWHYETEILKPFVMKHKPKPIEGNVCAHCGSVNPYGRGACLGCGAPLGRAA